MIIKEEIHCFNVQFVVELETTLSFSINHTSAASLTFTVRHRAHSGWRGRSSILVGQQSRISVKLYFSKC